MVCLYCGRQEASGGMARGVSVGRFHVDLKTGRPYCIDETTHPVVLRPILVVNDDRSDRTRT